MTEPTRIAVLGGTFDPVHLGHLAIVTAARDAIGAGEAWLVPAKLPALREPPVAPAPMRLAMLEAAARTVPGIRVDDLELRRDGPSYTMDTLVEIEDRKPAVQPWWVVGADAVRGIGGWHRSADLVAIVRLVVVQRTGQPPFDEREAQALGLAPERTVVLEVMPPAISASEVRRRAGAGETLDGLVPPSVATIIDSSGVYRQHEAVR